MSDDLLERTTFLASCDPCQIQRRDMLMLLERAGLKQSPVHDLIAAEQDGPLLLQRSGILEVLRRVRR